MRISCYTTVPIFQNDYSKLIKYKKIVTFNSFIATQESWGNPWSIGTRNWKVHVEHNWQSHHLQGVPKGLQNFEGDVRRLDFWTNFGHPGDLELFAPFWAISGHFRLGAVHKWRHHFWGVSRHPFPLSSCHLSATQPPSLYAQFMKRTDPRENSVRRFADDYPFSSAALSMFRCDKTLEICFKLGACLKL